MTAPIISTAPSDIKAACASGTVAVLTLTVSLATTVELLQALAALFAIGSGTYSFYLAFRHSNSGKKKARRKAH
jgi:hypothetical protein